MKKKVLVLTMMLVVLASSAWAQLPVNPVVVDPSQAIAAQAVQAWDPFVSMEVPFVGFRSRKVHVGANVFLTAKSHTMGESSPQAFAIGDPTENEIGLPADNCYYIPELDYFKKVTATVMLGEMGDRGLNLDRVKYDGKLSQNGDKCLPSLCIEDGNLTFDGQGMAPGFYGLGGVVGNSLGKKQFKLLFWTQAYGRNREKDYFFISLRSYATKPILDAYCKSKEGCATYEDASEGCKRLALSYLLRKMGWDIPELLDYDRNLESYHSERSRNSRREVTTKYGSEKSEAKKLHYYFKVVECDGTTRYTGGNCKIVIKDDEGSITCRVPASGVLNSRDSDSPADAGCDFQYYVYLDGVCKTPSGVNFRVERLDEEILIILPRRSN